METVSALFVANVVGLASCAEQTPVAEPGELSADDDYGYGLDTDGTQEAVSMASRQESAVEIEVIHYLDNPSKELSSLLAYPHVKAALMKYHPAVLGTCRMHV